MKRKSLPKTLFLATAIFGLTAFLFVNVHANLTIPVQVRTEVKLDQQAQVKEGDEAEEQEVRIPDVSALGRLFELAKKLVSVAN